MFRVLMIRILLVTLAIILPILGMEAYIRLAGIWRVPDQASRNHFISSQIPGVPFLMRPNLDMVWNGNRVRTNSLGLADLHEPSVAASSCKRILVFGNSFTFGFGVDFDETYPRRLEYLLNKDSFGSCYQVINAAQDAFSIRDKLALLRHLQALYRPHVIFMDSTSYDYDDSYAVSTEGYLYPPSSYVYEHNILTVGWRFVGRFLDLENSLASKGFQRVGITDGLESILNRSFSYLYFRPRVSRLAQRFGLSQLEGCRSGKCLDFMPQYRDEKGQLSVFPRYSPVFLSPFAQRRYYAALNEIVSLAEKEAVPLVIMSIYLNIEPDLIAPYKKLYLIDLSDLVKMPSHEFVSKFNINWDFHPSPHGHQMIAAGLARFFYDNEILSAAPRPPQPALSRPYWGAFSEVQRKQLSSFSNFVDFQKRIDIHQLLGGLRPELVYDGVRDGFAVLLRTGPANRIRFSGKASVQQTVNVRVISGTVDRRYELAVPSGLFSVEKKMDADFSDSVVDVQVGCGSRLCAPMEVYYLGLE